MFYQDDLLNEVYYLIKVWKPKKYYSKEPGYRDDLLNFLYVNLNRPKSTFLFTLSRRVSVKKEAGESRCDIAVGTNHICIELKKDLDSKSKIDQLLGQIDRYIKEYHHIFIVLVGYTTPSKLSDLKENIELKNHHYGQRILIINKASLVDKPLKKSKKKRKGRKK